MLNCRTRIHVCIYVRVHVCNIPALCTFTHTFWDKMTLLCLYVCVCVFVYVYVRNMCTHTCIYTYIYIYIRTHIKPALFGCLASGGLTYICAHTHAHIHIHTDIHRNTHQNCSFGMFSIRRAHIIHTCMHTCMYTYICRGLYFSAFKEAFHPFHMYPYMHVHT
jgi:hypothetical protein